MRSNRPLRTGEVAAESTGEVTAEATGEVLTPEVTPEVVPGEAVDEVAGEVAGEVTGEVAGEVTGEVLRLLTALRPGPKSRTEAQESLSLIAQSNFRHRYLEPSLKLGLVEMTIPDKPHSRNQRYRLTPLGLEVLKKATESS